MTDRLALAALVDLDDIIRRTFANGDPLAERIASELMLAQAMIYASAEWSQRDTH